MANENYMRSMMGTPGVGSPINMGKGKYHVEADFNSQNPAGIQKPHPSGDPIPPTGIPLKDSPANLNIFKKYGKIKKVVDALKPQIAKYTKEISENPKLRDIYNESFIKDMVKYFKNK